MLVETGIGLGVFAGNHIGIDATSTSTSLQLQFEDVLQKDGSSYRHIRAVVFALPLLGETRPGQRSLEYFMITLPTNFVKSRYTGAPIPVTDR